MIKFLLTVIIIHCFTLLGQSEPIDAFAQVNAVDFSEISDGPKKKLDDGTNTILGVHSLTNESWFGFDSIDFGQGAEACSLSVAASGSSGGTIELWIDGRLTGELIADIEMKTTGSWANWVTLYSPITKVSGVHSLHLFFKTKSGSKYVCDINWFKFVPAEVVSRQSLPEERSGGLVLRRSGKLFEIGNLQPGELAITVRSILGNTVWSRSTKLGLGEATFYLESLQSNMPNTVLAIQVSNNGRNSILRLRP